MTNFTKFLSRWAMATAIGSIFTTTLITSSTAHAGPQADEAAKVLFPSSEHEAYAVLQFGQYGIGYWGLQFAGDAGTAMEGIYNDNLSADDADLMKALTGGFGDQLVQYMDRISIDGEVGQDFVDFAAAKGCTPDNEAGCDTWKTETLNFITPVIEAADGPNKTMAQKWAQDAANAKGMLGALLAQSAIYNLDPKYWAYLVLRDGADNMKTIDDPKQIPDGTYGVIAGPGEVYRGALTPQEDGSIKVEGLDGTSQTVTPGPETVVQIGGLQKVEPDDLNEGDIVCLELEDGSEVCGKVKEITDDEIVLIDEDGNEIRVPRDKVKNIWRNRPSDDSDKKSKKPDRKKGDKDKKDKGSNKMTCSDVDGCDFEEFQEAIKALRETRRQAREECYDEQQHVQRFSVGVGVGNMIGTNQGLKLVDAPFALVSFEGYVLDHRLMSLRAAFGGTAFLGASKNGVPGEINKHRMAALWTLGMTVGPDVEFDNAMLRFYGFGDVLLSLTGEPKFGIGGWFGLGMEATTRKRPAVAHNVRVGGGYMASNIQPDYRPGDANPGIPNLNFPFFGMMYEVKFGRPVPGKGYKPKN